MSGLSANRRQFLSGGGALAASLSIKYAVPAAHAQAGLDQPYGAWEDVMRQKWTWDAVVHGSRGINCTGHCAFNIYVKDGVVWREEQQGEYGRSGEDTPDYGPRGCQKGNRQAKYMYSKGRVLYPMKRVGERGEGKWERISWDQAATEIAEKFVDYATEFGPTSITLAMGTAMILKRASFASLFRFANLSGIVVPETFAGVGDLPVGAYQVLGYELPGDNMAAVFKSRVCLVWVCNPAVTRIPDAHFFWEARYNGTEVITITPDFNASAMHSSKWLNPKPGTDIALAMSMVQVILEDRTIEWDYVREQTDLPFLVRKDNRKFLRETDIPGQQPGESQPGFFFLGRGERWCRESARDRIRFADSGSGGARARNDQAWRYQTGARGQLGCGNERGPGRSHDGFRIDEGISAGLYAGARGKRNRCSRGRDSRSGPNLRDRQAGDDFRRLSRQQMGAR